MSTPTSYPNGWQQLKDEWTAAMDQDKQVTINVNVLYLPDRPHEPMGLDVLYTINGESFTRTFRGIPEGYDAVRRPE